MAKAVVNSWIQNSTGNNQNFNDSGRAYPDVAAHATNFQLAINGGTQSVYGTSAVTPAFASIIQLINSDRLSNRKGPIGFLNPWRYNKAASALFSGCSGKVWISLFNVLQQAKLF